MSKIDVSKCENYDNFFGWCYEYIEEKDEFDGLGWTYCKCRDIDDCDFKIKGEICEEFKNETNKI